MNKNNAFAMCIIYAYTIYFYDNVQMMYKCLYTDKKQKTKYYHLQ